MKRIVTRELNGLVYGRSELPIFEAIGGAEVGECILSISAVVRISDDDVASLRAEFSFL